MRLARHRNVCFVGNACQLRAETQCCLRSSDITHQSDGRSRVADLSQWPRISALRPALLLIRKQQVLWGRMGGTQSSFHGGGFHGGGGRRGRFPISYRELAAMLSDRSALVVHTTRFRWVQAYVMTLARRLRRHLWPCNGNLGPISINSLLKE